ncbi:MAG TPA: glycosyltransferase N-terminal domain-containing protein [Flavobacteriales bacterium]|nr:glycosyltransferase N-terminal domain-containing protein [Flavobacteriales bacterium]
MAFLLRLGTTLYHAGIALAAPIVPKARAWVDGRRGLWQRLGSRAADLQGCLWVHCASVGEFEQARPVLETIKRARPDLPILLTFYSPSGYAARKDHPLATHVEYLPADTAANARRLVALVRPRMAIFIKYEFWYAHLQALKQARVPTYLVSAIFRRSQPFFRWYGRAHRAMLTCFEHLFVQDEGSRELLAGIGISQVTVSGDTRFDRVAAIVSKDEVLPRAAAFRASTARPVLVAGSSWPDDERYLAEALDTFHDLRAVIVPHELGEATLRTTASLFPQPLVWWSDTVDPADARTLLVDEMGQLSKLYKYADITYVGGGFKSGIHNTLEAAAWGRPVIFGPNYQRFAEAHGLIAAGAGFPIHNAEELRQVLGRLLQEPGALHKASEAAGRYVRERTGATGRVTEVVLGRL